MRKYTITILLLATLLLAGFAVPEDTQACTTFCHYVKRGENLTQIAQHYGVSVYAIQQANNLWNPNLIFAGQCLKIPCSATPPQPKPPTGCTKTHVVKPGEYLKVIAAKYGTTWQAIAQLNGISNPNRIYVGQRLKIPVKCSTPSPEPPQPGTGAWTGRYWNNRFLSGNPKFTRNSSRVDFSWGNKGPGGGIGGTNFSARFTRTRYFDAGTYRFNVIVDDGVRVFVDGVKVIDEWHDTAPRHYIADRELSAGNHTLQIDYYQNKGGAQIKFWPDALNVPKTWKGEYFNNTSVSGAPVTTKYYNAVNFNWGNKSPEYGVTADYFSARLTTESYFDGSKVRFSATVDDGIRIFLDGNLILDDWRLGSARTIHVDRVVGQGNHRVRVEFFEYTGDAVCKVSWTKY